MKKSKLIIQIDCDSEWVIEQHYKLSDPINYTYYSEIERFIFFLNKYGLKGTFFVIGQDMNDDNLNWLRSILNYKHEIANHSFSHNTNFLSLSAIEFANEISKTNRTAKYKLGCDIKGFRAPNFNMNIDFFNILSLEGIEYDSSFLMTPLFRILKKVKRIDAKNAEYLPNKMSYRLYKHLTNSVSPFNINGIVEIPISIFPYVRFPCHFSYLLAINKHIALNIIKMLIKWHVKNDKPLVYLFHLSDLVENKYLRGLEARLYNSLEERLFLLDLILGMFSESFDSMTTYEYVTNLGV